MRKKPTDAELEILSVLWENGPSSVRFVHTELNKNREVVYTTTLKMMQVMAEKKGLLKRDTSQKTHLYEAVIQREMIRDNMVDKLLNTVFEGSPLQLAMHALGHQKTSKQDLEQIKDLIQQLEKDNHDNS